MKIKTASVLLTLVAFVGLLQSAAACRRLTDLLSRRLYGDQRYSYHCRRLDEMEFYDEEELDYIQDNNAKLFDSIFDERRLMAERRLREGLGGLDAFDRRLGGNPRSCHMFTGGCNRRLLDDAYEEDYIY